MKKILKQTLLYRSYINIIIRKERKIEIDNNRSIRQPLIKKFIPKNGIGAELGVLRGDFSQVLLSETSPRELHLIDPWYFLNAEWSWAGGQNSTIIALIEILRKFRSQIEKEQVFVHVQDDLIVLKQFKNNYFDWAYIDSSHGYEHTVQELCLLSTKVKHSGIICGDDWNPDPEHRHHGVYKAVIEFIKSENYEILYANTENKQWFIKKIIDKCLCN